MAIKGQCFQVQRADPFLVIVCGFDDLVIASEFIICCCYICFRVQDDLEAEAAPKEKAVSKNVVSGGLTHFPVAADLAFVDFNSNGDLEVPNPEFKAIPWNMEINPDVGAPLRPSPNPDFKVICGSVLIETDADALTASDHIMTSRILRFWVQDEV